MKNPMLLLLLAGMFALLLVRCNIIRPDPLPPDATVTEKCEAACKNMARLEVPGWEGSPDGISCADVCVDYLTGDPPLPFPVDCLAGAGTRTEAEACGE